MYKPKDTKTPNLFPDLFPMGGGLNKENRWLKLAPLVPWEGLESIYTRYFSPTGRPAKDSRLVCGLLMVKWLENYSDERTVQEFNENPYMQLFCGLETFVTDERTVEASVLSRARKKLGRDVFGRFEREIMSALSGQEMLKMKFPKSAMQVQEACWWQRPFKSAGKIFRGIFGKNN